MDANFDPSKMGFVLEALGACQEAFIKNAQSSVKSALVAAETAAFNLFKNELMNDQAI